MNTNWTTSRETNTNGSWMRRTLGPAHIDAAFAHGEGGEFRYVLTVEGTDRYNLFCTLAEAKAHAAWVLATA